MLAAEILSIDNSKTLEALLRDEKMVVERVEQ
jgi:hypothetical protein